MTDNEVWILCPMQHPRSDQYISSVCKQVADVGLQSGQKCN